MQLNEKEKDKETSKDREINEEEITDLRAAQAQERT